MNKTKTKVKTAAKTFSDKVRDVVRKIPRGTVMTYAEVARKAGNANGARAVGAVMRNNFDPSVPCHRVIMSDGTMGSYNRGGEAKKAAILKTEGYVHKAKLHKK